MQTHSATMQSFTHAGVPVDRFVLVLLLGIMEILLVMDLVVMSFLFNSTDNWVFLFLLD